jgi:hypothetical protein
VPVGATIGAITSIAGIGIQAYGQHEQGQAQQAADVAKAKAAESSAQLDDFNATVASEQSQDALDRGNLQADEYRATVRGAIGTTRTIQAASGVDVGYGSAADVQADEAFLGKLDETTIRSNAVRQAWGYQVQSLNYKQQGVITRETGQADIAAGDAAANAGNIAAVGSIATGAGSLLQKKYGFGSNA